MDISVILPVHNERQNLRAVITELRDVLTRERLEFEIIAIDDGSTDDSFATLVDLQNEFTELIVRRFWTNRGQASAFDAGFRVARGGVVATMDADGQNDPADLPRLLKRLHQGADFVSGRRVQREDRFFHRRLPSMVANALIRRVTKTTVRDLGCSLKVFRAEITRNLMLYGEMHRFIGPVVESSGARVAELDVNHRPRRYGKSKYGLGRTFKVLLDLTTVWFFLNFHHKPIYVFGGLSLASIFGASILFVYVLYEKYGEGVFVHRNPLFLIGIALVISAVQFIVFGLLAELLMRTYFESQNKRPYAFRAPDVD